MADTKASVELHISDLESDEVVYYRDKAKSEKEYKAMYISSDGTTREGWSSHLQVDSGYGFTCDEKMLDIVKAIWSVGLKTDVCCQSNRDSGIGGTQWIIDRQVVHFHHDDPHKLLDFCLYLRSEMLGINGWNMDIQVDDYCRPSYPKAKLTFTEESHDRVTQAISKFASKDQVI